MLIVRPDQTIVVYRGICKTGSQIFAVKFFQMSKKIICKPDDDSFVRLSGMNIRPVNVKAAGQQDVSGTQAVIFPFYNIYLIIIYLNISDSACYCADW